MSSCQTSARHPKVLRTLYTRLAPIYDILVPLISGKARALSRNWLDVSDGEMILDLGTGTGLSLVSMARANPHGWTEGLDLTPAMISHARNRLAPLPHDRYSLQAGRATALPYPRNQFDAVHSSYLIDVLPSPLLQPAMAEISRVLRPGGRLLLVYAATPTDLIERIWSQIGRHLPWLLGGARPVDPRPALQKTGFRIQNEATRRQAGFRSAVLRATLFEAGPEDPRT